MKIGRRLLSIILIVTTLSAMLTGCGDSSKKDSVTLTVAHVLNETHPYHLAWTEVAKLVEERTDGAMRIEVFANGVLGNERDIIEGMQLGIVDISCMSTGALASFSPSFMALDLPFLFDSRENAYKVLDSEIGREMLDDLSDHMMVGIDFWENGFRDVSNSKRDVLVPEDLKGLKLRTLENELQMGTFTTLGANAIPMAWGEVYTALQQGTIDGQENPLATIYLNKIHDVTTQISLTEHFYAAAPVVMSKKTYDKLSPENQKVLVEAIQEVTDYERQISAQSDVDYLEALKADGVKIIEDIDKELWREACQPVYDKYKDQIGEDLLQRIQEKMNGKR